MATKLQSPCNENRALLEKHIVVSLKDITADIGGKCQILSRQDFPNFEVKKDLPQSTDTLKKQELCSYLQLVNSNDRKRSKRGFSKQRTLRSQRKAVGVNNDVKIEKFLNQKGLQPVNMDSKSKPSVCIIKSIARDANNGKIKSKLLDSKEEDSEIQFINLSGKVAKECKVEVTSKDGLIVSTLEKLKQKNIDYPALISTKMAGDETKSCVFKNFQLAGNANRENSIEKSPTSFSINNKLTNSFVQKKEETGVAIINENSNGKDQEFVEKTAVQCDKPPNGSQINKSFGNIKILNILDDRTITTPNLEAFKNLISSTPSFEEKTIENCKKPNLEQSNKINLEFKETKEEKESSDEPVKKKRGRPPKSPRFRNNGEDYKMIKETLDSTYSKFSDKRDDPNESQVLQNQCAKIIFKDIMCVKEPPKKTVQPVTQILNNSRISLANKNQTSQVQTKTTKFLLKKMDKKQLNMKVFKELMFFENGTESFKGFTQEDINYDSKKKNVSNSSKKMLINVLQNIKLKKEFLNSSVEKTVEYRQTTPETKVTIEVNANEFEELYQRNLNCVLQKESETSPLVSDLKKSSYLDRSMPSPDSSNFIEEVASSTTCTELRPIGKPEVSLCDTTTKPIIENSIIKKKRMFRRRKFGILQPKLAPRVPLRKKAKLVLPIPIPASEHDYSRSKLFSPINKTVIKFNKTLIAGKEKPLHSYLASIHKRKPLQSFSRATEEDHRDPYAAQVNPNSGKVLKCFYHDYNLIVVQEETVSFWEQSGLGSFLESQKMWINRGTVERLKFDDRYIRKEQLDEFLHQDKYVELWAREHKSDFREKTVCDIFAVAYFKKSGNVAPAKKLLQLENVYKSAQDISYLLVKYANVILLSWKETKPNQIVTRCYHLAADFETIEAIREFDIGSHVHESLHNIDGCDRLILAFGEGKVTAWNLQVGYKVQTWDMQGGIKAEDRLLSLGCDRGFIFALYLCNDVQELRLIAFNVLHSSWKILQQFKLLPEFNSIQGVVIDNGFLVVFHEDGLLGWNIESGYLVVKTTAKTIDRFLYEESVISLQQCKLLVHNAMSSIINNL